MAVKLGLPNKGVLTNCDFPVADADALIGNLVVPGN
jgi:hypothetical protein